MTARPAHPVLVTGGAGFIGKHLVRALVRSGRTVVAVDAKDELPAEVLAGITSPGFRYVQADVRDTDLIASLIAGLTEPDVIHLAADLRFHGEGVAAAPGDLLDLLATNSVATWELCRLAAEARAHRLIFVSTRSVFGSREAGAGPIREDDRYEPVGLYGDSKVAGELVVKTFRRDLGVDFATVRVTGGFGIWHGTAYPHIINMTRAVAAQQPFTLDRGADHSFEFTYIKDLAHGLMTVLESGELGHDTYHLSSGVMTSLGEVADQLRALDPRAQISLGPGALNDKGERARTVLDIQRLADDLGWRPQWPMKAALGDFLEGLSGRGYGQEI